MRFRFFALISLLVPALFSLPIFAQNTVKPEPSPAPRSMREIVMMPVVYKVDGLDKVRILPNLKYTNANDPNLLMDVYTPPNLAAGEKRPAVIFVHGGAGSEFTPKDWGIYTSWGRLVAASGLAAVTFTHRLTPQKQSLEDSASDLAAAIDYVRKNADTLNIDKDRICLAAYSAGGPLLAAAIRDKPEFVRCMVFFYAFLDIQQGGNLFTAHERPETLRKFSPITYFASSPDKIAPIFVGRAGLDAIPTMNDSIDRGVREALAKGVSVTLANHPRGVHGFDNQNDDKRSREIIINAIAFMKLHLQDKTP